MVHLTTTLSRPFPEASVLSLDLETTGLSSRDDSIVTIAVSDGRDAVVYDVRGKEMGGVGKWVESCIFDRRLIAHNAAFDLSFLRQKYGVPYPQHVFDTMLAESLITAGYDDQQVNLKDTAKRWLNLELDKSLQTSFTLEGELTDEQLDYATYDVIPLIELARLQQARIKEEGLGRVWEIERRALPVFAEMVRKGVKVDLDLLRPLLAEATERRDALLEDLQTKLTPHVMWLRINKRDEVQEELDLWKERYDAEVARLEEDWVNLLGAGKAGLANNLMMRWFEHKWTDETVDKSDSKIKGQKRYVKAHVKEWRTTPVGKRPLAPKLDESPINLNSPQQVLYALEKLGVTLPDLQGKTVQAALVDIAPDVRDEIIVPLLKYKKDEKLITSFGERLIAKIDVDGRVHGSFRQIGTSTGRPSCIAEGALVDAPRDLLRYPRGIPIEKVEVGQHVYSFDGEGVPRTKKVLAVLQQGVKPVLKLVWRASGNKSYVGELKATPDHLVRLLDGPYKRLDELQPGDKLTFLSRVIGSEGYARLGWGTDERPDEHFHLMGTAEGHETHHINEQKLDNRIDNLLVVHWMEHHRIHGNGYVYDPKPSPYSPDELNDILSDGIKRALETYGHDFVTWKRWAAEAAISIPDLRIKKCPVTADALVEMLKDRSANSIATELDVSIKTVQRWARNWDIQVRDGRRKREVDLPVNHSVVAVVDEGETLPTYDLTIEDTPNFVVNEVCVHNCSDPNLLQMPSDDKKAPPEKRFRRVFRADDGKLMIVADYSQMELRILAQMSRDPRMREAFSEGFDLHTYTASLMFGVAFDAVTDKQRKTAKTLNFGICYGMGPNKLRATLAAEAIYYTPLEARKALDDWKRSYPDAAAWLIKQQSLALQQGWTATPLGRRRHFHLEHLKDEGERGMVKRRGANHVIQGANADVTKLAMVLIHENLNGRGNIVLNVYDEIVTEVDEEIAPLALDLVRESMVMAAQSVLVDVPVTVDAVISHSWSEADLP